MRKIKNIKGDIIVLKKKGEREMPIVNCPICQGKMRTDPILLQCEHSAQMQGIIKCLRCMHEFPITIVNNCIQKLDVALPGAQSDRLNSSVPTDLKEDIQEAERANYAQCYKACVTMCRRAIQLGVMDKGIPDAPFGSMLDDALRKKLLTQDIYNLAKSIKGFGDIGAHRREQLDEEEVKMVIHATVRMLNEIFL